MKSYCLKLGTADWWGGQNWLMCSEHRVQLLKLVLLCYCSRPNEGLNDWHDCLCRLVLTVLQKKEQHWYFLQVLLVNKGRPTWKL